MPLVMAVLSEVGVDGAPHATAHLRLTPTHEATLAAVVRHCVCSLRAWAAGCSHAPRAKQMEGRGEARHAGRVKLWVWRAAVGAHASSSRRRPPGATECALPLLLPLLLVPFALALWCGGGSVGGNGAVGGGVGGGIGGGGGGGELASQYTASTLSSLPMPAT